ncbi:metallo-beta-lactamase family protein [Marinobacter santoriniensis NKSG1]|uniref:Metallo-beta-lactamase family protein n=1 Tax=Marinobacter santoriniensis NKSG1 TaxID=1288826 RepID=M7CUS2_9GAMM|nr:MBL fold metallo-hydrolase [Marinobacter santoriniensis]EMP56869.1 metallo-beta-lactamase family protein [Marinobacter santoriniensis NKSG1]
MSLKYRIIPVTPFQQNCSLIWCDATGKAAVVDPGGDLDRIRSAIAEEGVTVEKILLTHAHIDHAGGTAELAKALSLPIEGPHRDDNFWIQGLPQQAQMFGFPASEVFTPDHWLEDGDTVTVGEETLEVLHCPGHTPGHVVFFHQASGLALVGDVLFQGSIGRTDFPKGDYNTLVRSIREKLFPLGDAVAFIPGHGPMSTFGQERKSNPFVSDHRG